MASSPAADRKILYVEDNLDTSELVKAVLNGLGYHTSVVPNISEAKLVIHKSPFLMFLIDVRLPDGNGIDLCRWIRETDKSTPIAVYSANPTYVTEALSAGAQAFVPKSADIDLLESTVLQLTSNGRTDPFTRCPAL